MTQFFCLSQATVVESESLGICYRVIYDYIAFAVFFFEFVEALCLSIDEKNPANKVPEIEYHTQETAHIIADSGVDAN